MHACVSVCVSTHVPTQVCSAGTSFLCPLLGVCILFRVLFLPWQGQPFHAFPFSSSFLATYLQQRRRQRGSCWPPLAGPPLFQQGALFAQKLRCISGALSTEHAVWDLLWSPPAFWSDFNGPLGLFCMCFHLEL